jgi:dTDP-L-rhamnose 4-epimerase
MKALVTGGAGFIGSFIVDELVRRGHEVTILDNLEPQVHPGGQQPDYLNPRARFVQGDVRDYETLKHLVCASEVVFHKAAAVGVGQSQYEIKRYVDVNVGGTANLLDILVNQKHRVRKVIVAASMSSYGEGVYRCDGCGPVRPALRTEEMIADGVWEPRCPVCSAVVTPQPTAEEAYQYPNSIYAQTKKDQEDMCLNIGRTYGIPAVSLRYFNAYGPRQSLSNPYNGVLAIFLSRLKNDNRPVIFEDGCQTRDFVSVHDIAAVNMLAMERDEADYEIFNVGSGAPVTIRSAAEQAAAVLAKDIAPEITMKFRKGDVRHCYADMRKIEARLGFTPAVSFEDGLREVVAWSHSARAEDHFDKAAKELKEKGLV